MGKPSTRQIAEVIHRSARAGAGRSTGPGLGFARAMKGEVSELRALPRAPREPGRARLFGGVELDAVVRRRPVGVAAEG
jgi:hypothetical protein